MADIKQQVKRLIYDQNRQKMGVVKTGNPQGTVIRDTVHNDTTGYNPDILWKSRSYYFDRGGYVELDPISFSQYVGASFTKNISSDAGNFLDNGISAGVNAVYGCVLRTNKSKTVRFRIKAANSTVAVYLDGDMVFSSGNTAYVESDINLNIKGSRVLRIYWYCTVANGTISISGQPGNQVDSWASLDVVAPPAPEWIDSNPVTSFAAPRSRTPVVRLKWKDVNGLPTGNDTNGLTNQTTFDIQGYGIWRSLKASTGSATRVNGSIFYMSGDKRGTFATGASVEFSSNLGTLYQVAYTSYDPENDITLVAVGSAISGSTSDTIYVYRFQSIATIPYVPQPDGEFDWDDTNVELGTSYSYAITAYGVFANHSPYSGIETIAVPGLVTPTYSSANNVKSTINDIIEEHEEGAQVASNIRVNVGAAAVYVPLLVYDVLITDDYTQSVLIQVASNTGNTETYVQKTGEIIQIASNRFVKDTYFTHTQKGTTYSIRMAAVGAGGQLSSWGSWVTEVAGDSTGPGAISSGNVTLAVSTYGFTGFINGTWTYPNDFSHFEWFVNTSNSFPTGNPIAISGTNTANIRVAPGTYYVFVRGVDTSGNYSSSHTTSVGTVTVKGINSVYEFGTSGQIQLVSGGATVIDASGNFRKNVLSSDGAATLLDTTNRKLLGRSGATLLDLNPSAGTADMEGDLTVTGTITGGTIQTSASGKRIVLRESDNTMRMYNSSNVEIVTMDDDVFGNGMHGFLVKSHGAYAVGEAGAGNLRGGLSFGESIKLNLGLNVLRHSSGWSYPSSTYRPMLIQMEAGTTGESHIYWHVSDTQGFIDIGDRRMSLSSSRFSLFNLDEAVIDCDIVNDDILYPAIVMDNSSPNEALIVIDVKKLDGVFTERIDASHRGAIRWWISNSAFGDPVTMAGSQGVSYVKGNSILPAGLTANTVNYTVTDAAGTVLIYIENENLSAGITYYFHAEIQGIVYYSTMVLNTSPTPS